MNNQTQEQPTYYRFLCFMSLAFAPGIAADNLSTYMHVPVVSIILLVVALLAVAYAVVQIRVRQRRMNAS